MGPYFFCGIGGSGMLPLAMILNGQGVKISGSDRSFDQGRTLEKKQWLEKQGIHIVAQNGEGLTPDFEALIVSSAVEDTIPEVKKAKELNIPIIKRAELLARLFNQAKTSIAVAGTSGKSTTTGMLAWVLTQAHKNPTVMNGANFLNFVSPEAPFASAIVGDKDLFVSECDESDGSIVLYHPDIAILNNIALDHKPVEELIPIFKTYLDQSKYQVLNLDNPAIAQNFESLPSALTYGYENNKARLVASNYVPTATGSKTRIKDTLSGEEVDLTLAVQGRHNLENALSAIGAGLLLGLNLKDTAHSLSTFSGVARRLQNIGNTNNINVIDDFAHNPDKIRATLHSLKEHKGRLLILFQMHGYGPFKLMKDALATSFIDGLSEEDCLFMPDVLYLGGTVDRSYTARDFINEINERGAKKGVVGEWCETRDEIIPKIISKARNGDRIIVMGARDDTLTTVAKNILEGLR